MIKTIAISIIILSIFFSWLYAFIIVLGLRKKNRNTTLPHYPEVSIFIPLRNIDDGLEENITSIFNLDYPCYDIHFAVDTMDDPCIDTLVRVRARFPHIRSYVIAAGHSVTGNPKINKLAQMERTSDAALFWVIDSDVRVSPNTLKNLVAEYVYNDSKMTFSPIRCMGAKTFGSVMEMCYVNFFLSGSVLAAWKLLRKRIVVGKSLLIERNTLEKFGGFAYFSDVLSEDYWLGETFAQSGFNVRCADVWVDNIKETSTIKTYIGRMTRWAKLRFNLNSQVYLSEILLNPVALAILFLPALESCAATVAIAAIIMRIAAEYTVFFSLNKKEARRIPLVLCIAPAVIIKDLLLLIVYFAPFFSRSVVWRGGSIKIGRHTLIGFNAENLLYDGA
jgi:ceramide glucosyltransferase